MGIIEKYPAISDKGKHKRLSKDNHFGPQLQVVREYFDSNTAYRLMCSKYTGIRISNIWWLVDMLFDTQDIQILKKDYFEIFGAKVQFLSCDHSQWLKPGKKLLTLTF